MLGSIFIAVLAFASPSSAEPTVEVMHFWTSSGEAAAMDVLRRRFAEEGGRWIDAPIKGGGGAAAKKALEARKRAGRLPDASTFGSAPDPERVVPLAVERGNVLFLNIPVLKEVGIEPGPGWPKTWKQFAKAAKMIREQEFPPLAHGRQSWQDEFLFSAAAIGAVGGRYYEDVLVPFDAEALSKRKVRRIFKRLDVFRKAAGGAPALQEWTEAVERFRNDFAGFLVHGSWAQGELLASGAKMGKDFICAVPPGNRGVFVGTEPVALRFYPTSDPERAAGQRLLMKIASDPEVRRDFARLKGGVPAGEIEDEDALDPCAKRNLRDLKKGRRVPFFGTGLDKDRRAAAQQAISGFLRGLISADEATSALLKAARSTR